MPQIDESGDLPDGFIRSVTDRNIAESVIVQAWSLETNAAAVNAVLQALQLLSEKKQTDLGKVAAAGIEYVSVPTTVAKARVQTLKGTGLNVWVYALNTLVSAESQYAKGAVGIFADDPWRLIGTSGN